MVCCVFFWPKYCTHSIGIWFLFLAGYFLYFISTLVATCEGWLCWTNVCGFSLLGMVPFSFFNSKIFVMDFYILLIKMSFSPFSPRFGVLISHPKLVEHKDQNWVCTSGDYLVFHSVGTQFKEAVISYLEFLKMEYHFKALPAYEPCQLNGGVSISSPCWIFLNRNRRERW